MVFIQSLFNFHILFILFLIGFFPFLANAMVGPRAWVGGFFSRGSNRRFGSDKFLNYTLSPIQVIRISVFNYVFLVISILNRSWRCLYT